MIFDRIGYNIVRFRSSREAIMNIQQQKLFEAISHNDLQAITTALNEHVDFNFKNEKSQTLLHAAVLGNHLKMVEKLLESSSIDPNLKNNFGEAPLHLAVKKNYIEIVKRLLEHKSINPNLENHSVKTPLHLSVIKKI